MLPGVRSALSRLSVRSMQQAAKAPRLERKKADFHDNYGMLLLLSGALFCLVSWTYALSQCDLPRYMSPAGRVRPKAWKRQ